MRSVQIGQIVTLKRPLHCYDRARTAGQIGIMPVFSSYPHFNFRILTRARVAVSATVALVGRGGGGGIRTTTPPNTKPKRDRSARKKVFDCLNEYIIKCSKHFFSLDQYWGNQRSPKVKCGGVSYYFPRDVPLSQKLLSVACCGKKQSIALLKFLREDAVTIDIASTC